MIRSAQEGHVSSSSLVAHSSSSKASVCTRALRFAARFRYLGLLGYVLEWLMSATHLSQRLHRSLRQLTSPKAHLLAVTCILIGHCAEHMHQEDENHEQEARIAALESRVLGAKKNA
eukprot:TRINITY_DN2020_c0_g1_i1.p1 TRINITY_DN2020_c0_g1~~TRINITY_DN2020_c0_g1_i1.p1  ORF type:complete len:117 (+),score=15.35 TRINITY_DN2020_c0_g1_i1:101-451(+)